MMQHLATQNTDTATERLLNRQTQEQRPSERGHEFAELMERNRVADSQREASDRAHQRAQDRVQQSNRDKSDAAASSSQRANQQRASQEQASRQRAIENERRENAQSQARADAQESQAAERARDLANKERAAERAAESAQHRDNQQSSSRADASNRQAEASQQADDSAQQNQQQASDTNNEQSDTGQPEEQMANTDQNEAAADAESMAGNSEDSADVNADDALLAGNESANGDNADIGGGTTAETAVDFDWLSMLDKLHGKQGTADDNAKQFDANGDLIKADESPESDDNLAGLGETAGEAPAEEAEQADNVNNAVNAADILKGFTDAKAEQSESGAQASVKADTEVETDDLPNGEGESTDEQALTDILAMLDQLRAEEDASDDDLAALDKMIDDFMAKHPNLADSPLQQYNGKDWLNVDSKLLQGVIQAATGVGTDTASADKYTASADEGLAQRLLNSDAQQVQKVAEQLSQNLIPKAVNTPENRASFVDNLKAGLEDMKTQLKSSNENSADLGQVVKDALAKIDGVSQSDISGAKVQQTLATASATLDTASNLSNPKPAAADAMKAQGAVTAKDNASATTQAELNRQQQAGQMERMVNMHKPEAAQQMVDKVQVMMNQKSLVADIRLDPPHLGGMKIKVDMSGEAASVNFVVQTQQAREALEQATPRLREMLEEQGIELGQSSVEQEAKQQSNNDGDGKMAGGHGGTGGEELDEASPEAQTVNVVNGSVNGIDYFA